jgi:hypothetical protein
MKLGVSVGSGQIDDESDQTRRETRRVVASEMT